jgi:hypothetical protein
MTPGVAASECIRLVREAVTIQRAHQDAIRHPETRPDRLPDLDLEGWYKRAGAAVDALDADREARHA